MHHLNLYPVCLPSFLPDAVLEKMIQHFGGTLYKKLHQLIDNESLAPGHRRNVSLESAGKSVSSAGSIDANAVEEDRPVS